MIEAFQAFIVSAIIVLFAFGIYAIFQELSGDEHD